MSLNYGSRCLIQLVIVTLELIPLLSLQCETLVVVSLSVDFDFYPSQSMFRAPDSYSFLLESEMWEKV